MKLAISLTMKNILLILITSTFLFSCKTVSKSQVKTDKANNLLTKNLELAYEKDAIKGFSVSVVNEKGLIY